MPSKKKTAPQKKTAPPAKKAKPAAKPVAKPKAAAKPAAKPKAKEAKKTAKANAAKPKAAAKSKPAAKPKTEAKKKIAPPAKKAKPAAKPVAKPTAAKAKAPKKKELPKKALPKALPKKTEKPAKSAKAKIESSLIVPGVKFMKISFFFDIGDEKDGKRKRASSSKASEKPTASSRPKIGNAIDTRDMVELLSQQLEAENKMYFEGCEGQICVKCGVNEVDPKYYVDKSLGHCVECATVLRLGESKEGVFSDAQQELLRRSMEKSIKNAKDIDESNIESMLGDIDIDDDSLEELALLTAEEESEP